ncbi:MAG: hypothetical protein E6J34_19315 [Chloroflexi bacterium]|nr:MAG: hypothetical protein E6J34_19315 [Chloroflexota bacterium]
MTSWTTLNQQPFSKVAQALPVLDTRRYNQGRPSPRILAKVRQSRFPRGSDVFILHTKLCAMTATPIF